MEVQPAQTNEVETVKRFANVNLQCIGSNLKRICKISAFSPFGKFLRTPTDALILIEFTDRKCGAVWLNYFRPFKNDKCEFFQFPNLYTKRSKQQALQF